ncbi:hypothetical protein [Streptomyces diastatochromogenes]|uniref:Uncharacterized protein n=1 Tax=Streptomyces diastatochromogenes TaxID=42236 RepID=A0A233S6L6_STRDA|nr:hypothetical protein [Streptomyces diastatochromogenes]MCZ0991510.1 hypothetical protein [Streptomyces diastatochromogenes]OXY91263.1 hypothetical protein BEK98_30410 [Streptomyces diastatochromogenes]
MIRGWTGEEIETGPRVRVTALLDPQPIGIVSTAPRREVYEKCLRATGSSEVEWVPLHVSEAGIREFGEDFWADLLAYPPLEMPRLTGRLVQADRTPRPGLPQRE